MSDIKTNVSSVSSDVSASASDISDLDTFKNITNNMQDFGLIAGGILGGIILSRYMWGRKKKSFCSYISDSVV